MRTQFDVDVLVIGAGPVGLALANELGMQAVRCLVIEQRQRVGYSPRAKLTNVRTAELLRRWGLADELRRASSMPGKQPSNVVFTTRLTGHVLARFENAFYRVADRDERFSEAAQWVPQYTLEEVLRAGAARRESVELRFDTKLTALTESPDGVTATVVDVRDGSSYEIRARYVVGADGGRSTARGLLGITMEGQAAVAPNLNVLFRAPDLRAVYERMPAIQYWTVNPQACVLMGPVDDRGLWYMIAARLADGVDASDQATAKRMVAAACGMDIDIEVVDVDPWYAHCLVANRYRSGRVFLAGDACHMHPPFGGHGMNMGIGDSMDLGWKLAATLHGWGGPRLLDSYEAERRPVHARVMQESTGNYALAGTGLLREHLESEGDVGEQARRKLGQEIRDGKRREFFNLGLVLGYRYGESSILPTSEGAPQEPDALSIDHVPSAQPGCLAPHFWLADGQSLFDLFGGSYTLLADDSVPLEDTQAFEDTARRLQIPVVVIRVSDGRFAQLYQADMALVRPDQHVAWRGDGRPDVEQLLRTVTGRGEGPGDHRAGVVRSKF